MATVRFVLAGHYDTWMERAYEIGMVHMIYYARLVEVGITPLSSDIITPDNDYHLPHTLPPHLFDHDTNIEPIMSFLIDEDELNRAKLVNPATTSIYDIVTHTLFTPTGQTTTFTLQLKVVTIPHNP